MLEKNILGKGHLRHCIIFIHHGIPAKKKKLFFLSQLFVQIAQCSVIVPKTKARAFYSWHLIQFRYFAKQFVSMCFWTCAYYLSLIAIICNGESDRSAATIKTTIPTTVPATVNTTKDNHQMNINFEISMKQFFLLI